MILFLTFIRFSKRIAFTLGIGLLLGGGSASAQGDPGLWNIESAVGDVIGNVALPGGQARQNGLGWLKERVYFNGTNQISARELSRTQEAVDLQITLTDSSSGQRQQGRLLVEWPRISGIAKGTLQLSNNYQLVTLTYQGPYSTAQPPQPGSGGIANNEPDENDAPGVGVTGPSYVLRNVPEGNRLVMRQLPTADAQVTGSLGRSDTQILVLQCLPSVDSFRWEQANLQTRLQLLDGVWCQVNHTEGSGFVQGKYLQPQGG